MPSVADLIDLSVEQIMDLQRKAQTDEEVDAITAIGREVARLKLKQAVQRFRANSGKFVAVTGRIIGHIDAIKAKHPGTPTPALKALLERYGEVLGQLHGQDAIRKTFKGEEPPAIRDEDAIGPARIQTPLDTAPRPEKPLVKPQPLNATAFEELADEYVSFFLRASILPARADKVREMAETAAGFKDKYDSVGKPMGIPWWWIAGAHMLESTFNFTRHLHNGDPLTARTVREPPGRPKTGEPPFSWEDSARDALERHKLGGLQDWSLPRALWRWERYNGFGYRPQGVPTPYLWSFSSIYEKGKFIKDKVFDKEAGSEQCGAAVLLKALHQGGRVPELSLDLVAENESKQPDPDADIAPVIAGSQPNIDNNIPAGSDFQSFFARQLPDIQFFKWHEFLVKGASNATNKLNTDPPKTLWPNVVPLARVLEAFRKAVGHPMALTSVYRSKAYNEAIGGAPRSQHMEFIAADFKVDGGGTTGQWAELLKKLRQQGAFEGGIGIYKTFVHVDVRGSRADWDLR